MSYKSYKKPATPDCVGRPGVIFQGHIDMVAAKTKDSVKNLECDGLDIYREGDFIKAKDTTLGADDGVAIAYALSVLDSSDISHPDFEALFTSDEEIGLLGASALDGSLVKNRLLINIDSDMEGIFTVGCAGGMRSDITLPVSREEKKANVAYKLSLCGLRGGHSGMEIGRGIQNAIKLLTGIFYGVSGVKVISLGGGSFDNAIPRDAECIFTAPEESIELIKSRINETIDKYIEAERDMSVTLNDCTCTDAPVSEEFSKRIFALLYELPNGIMAMSEDIPGLVETSLNLGILRLDSDKLRASFSVRSAKGKSKAALGGRLSEIASLYGASYSEHGDYPAWEYRRDSHLRDVMVEVYERMYAKKPEVLTIHAGLECGILAEKLEGLDSVSIGPDSYDIHTTEERLSLSSFERVYEYLLEVLKQI